MEVTDLITEARKLCEKWSLSDYAVFECEECIANMVIYKVAELVDALEKAEEQNKQLMHEVCKLACESLERDKALARLEAEVEHAITATRWIPVAERLPESNDSVLAIVNGKPHKNITLDGAYQFAAYYDDDGWIIEEFPEWETPVVIHWMPLPEPPKGE